MCLTEAGKIVRSIVAGVVIEMGDRQAGGKLQAAHCATLKRIVLVENPASLGLVADRC
jgi:hypothetical protein